MYSSLGQNAQTGHQDDLRKIIHVNQTKSTQVYDI